MLIEFSLSVQVAGHIGLDQDCIIVSVRRKATCRDPSSVVPRASEESLTRIPIPLTRAWLKIARRALVNHWLISIQYT
jgi:hypothetical protein